MSNKSCTFLMHELYPKSALSFGVSSNLEAHARGQKKVGIDTERERELLTGQDWQNLGSVGQNLESLGIYCIPRDKRSMVIFLTFEMAILSFFTCQYCYRSVPLQNVERGRAAKHYHVLLNVRETFAWLWEQFNSASLED